MTPEPFPGPIRENLRGRSVIVIGGGFGGLAAACYLAQAGAAVTLLEKNEQLGGRASRLRRDGFLFDMGPSWYLMPDAWERFFGHFGKRPVDFFKAERLDPHYRIFFKDGDRVDITGDRAAMRDLFEGYEAGAGAALDRYLAQSQQTYERAMPGFV
ncbi:MAG: phytoene desaturase family protein, partial [Anaerolineae bacterium]